MRGIPTPCITYDAKQNNITVLDVYKKLYNNEVIKFDLTNDGNKFVCRNNRDYTVSNVSEFTRTARMIKTMEIPFIEMNMCCINHARYHEISL